jgi:voltage-gated potassium channel
MDHLPRRLAWIGGSILLMIITGTIGFMVVEHYSAFDAFYFTLFTVTTVGYGEIPHPLSHAGRILNSFVIFFGVTTMFFAIGGVTQTAIELELNQYFGKRRIKNMIDKLLDHYIICGFGRVGRGAAEELTKAGVPFVIVDNSEERVTRAIKAGMLAALADATRDVTLREAGIDRACGLIATLASDADNLFVTLSAKTLNPALKICARVAEEENESKMKRAGAEFVFAPYNITGHRMAQSMLRPHVAQFIDLTTKDVGLNVGIEQIQVSEHSRFARRTIAEMQIRRELGVIVLAIRRSEGEMLFNPPADTLIREGDFLIAMGEFENLRRLESMIIGTTA